MESIVLTRAQVILLVAPPILVITTYFTYKWLAARLGPERGYLGGFLFYWIVWCFLLSLLTVGPEGLREMFKAPNPQFGEPAWLGLILLLGPVVASFFVTMFPARVKAATFAILVVSALFAIVNGTMEEVLWRGTYITAFHGNWLWGYLYPSVWFGLWHISPQVLFPSEGGALRFALMAIFLGLAFGWVAMKTGSIRWPVVAHILLDFAGLAGLSFLNSGLSG
jgi:membrane protease YdiL (CAAX protease family)